MRGDFEGYPQGRYLRSPLPGPLPLLVCTKLRETNSGSKDGAIKESGRFDLPIALGILAASGQVDAAKLAAFEFAGELSLAGDLRPVRGALAMALALQRDGAAAPRTLVLPPESAAQAAQVGGRRVLAASHLLEVVRALLPGDAATALPLAQADAVAAPAALPDLREVKGQAAAKRALELAAVGGHSLLMVGPPGSGKSMLAQRFAGLLPPLTREEALESAAVLSLTGAFVPLAWGRRVLRAPHHSASSAALVGGGSPPRPVGRDKVVTFVTSEESMP